MWKEEEEPMAGEEPAFILFQAKSELSLSERANPSLAMEVGLGAGGCESIEKPQGWVLQHTISMPRSKLAIHQLSKSETGHNNISLTALIANSRKSSLTKIRLSSTTTA